jgi:hypothetical protein
MRRALLAGILAVPLGLALGVGGQLAGAAHPGLGWVAALGVPWLAVGFLAGALARDRAAGAVAGAVTLVVATGAYYALHVAASRTLSAAPVALAWMPACVAAGGAFGAAGAAWRRGGRRARPAAAAVLAGALVGEAVLLWGEWPDHVVRVVLAAELAAGAALPFLLARRALPAALALTAVAAVVLGAAEGEVRDTLRAAGWAGR